MGNTIYASFADPSMAEKAAGALLDHGVKNEDLSIVSSHSGEGVQTTDVRHTTGSDGENDAKNAGDAAWGKTEAAGNTAASWGNAAAGAVADGLGQEGTAANYRAAADRNAQEARSDNAEANRELRDSVDMEGSDSSRSTSRTTTDNDSGDGVESAAKHGISTTTGADAGAGAVKGAGWGLGIGALAALASLLVPGVGIVVGGGALAAALGATAAATAAGAAAGAVTGYLKDQGVDAHIAEQYEETVRTGGAILAVSVPSGDCGPDEAMQVITKYGGANVNSYAATGRTGYVA